MNDGSATAGNMLVNCLPKAAVSVATLSRARIILVGNRPTSQQGVA